MVTFPNNKTTNVLNGCKPQHMQNLNMLYYALLSLRSNWFTAIVRLLTKIGLLSYCRTYDLLLHEMQPYLRVWRTKSYRHKNQILLPEEPNLPTLRFGCVFALCYARWLSVTYESPFCACRFAWNLRFGGTDVKDKNRTFVILCPFSRVIVLKVESAK